MRIQYIYNIVLIAMLISSCSSRSNDQNSNNSQDKSRFILLSTPTAMGSGEPNVFTDEQGNTYLSWVEQKDEISFLKFSKYSKGLWNDPGLIAEGENWFVNWADFPSLISSGDGNMVAHYLAKNGEDTFAYGVNMVFSSDHGQNWSNPIIPHETETETEHGFVSILPYNDGYIAAWLDGRDTGGGHGHNENGQEGAMSIRASFIGIDGLGQKEFLLDDKTCDCCQTSAAITSNGPIVAYRDRSDDEIRDIAVVRWTGNDWSQPRIVHTDNWLIPGCPVNGPVLAANGLDVALLWFTSPDQQSKIKLSFSTDGGESFGPPVQVDMGSPIGRLDMVMMNDGSVYVSWMEAEDEIGQILVAHYSNTGKMIEQMVIANNRSDRASGFPRITLNGSNIIVAWRDMMNEPKIATAIISTN